MLTHMTNAHKVFGEIPERTRPFERFWHSRKNKIKMDLKERRYEGEDWIQLTQDTLH
jgi:hypothetical protein